MANCNYKVNLTDIQNKYKFKIFNTGSYNDSDLRKMIESVFYALPRTTGSGTSVTLTDTAFSYMKNKLYATDTTQDTTTGKNLLDLSGFITRDTLYGLKMEYSNGKLFINGTSTQMFDMYIGSTTWNTEATAIINKLNSKYTTYVMSASKSGLEYYFTTTNGYAQTTATTSESNSISNFFVRIPSGKSFSNELLELQIEEGNTATSWEPYTNGASPNPDYPQTIHTITGNNNIKVEGKNLLDNSLLQVFNSKKYLSTINYSTMGKIQVQPNTTYSFIFKGTNSTLGDRNIYSYDKNQQNKTALSKTYITQDGYTTETFTTLANTKYLSFYAGGTVAYDTVEEFINAYEIMLILGNTRATYEPHKNQDAPLTLGDKEICKIGNYEDKIFKAIKGNEVYDSLASEEKATLDYGKWYLRKNIGKVVLNETTPMNSFSGGSGSFTYIVDIGMINADINTLGYLYSNYYKEIKNNDVYSADIPYGITRYTPTGTYNFAKLVFKNVDILNTAAFVTWLSTHNTSVYYVLATPTNELFNDTIQDQLEDIYNNMLSYEGQTNVSQVNDDLPFNINSTAIKDLNSL